MCVFLSLCVFRTDISQYCVYEDGKFVKNLSSLQNYSNPRYFHNTVLIIIVIVLHVVVALHYVPRISQHLTVLSLNLQEVTGY